MPKERIAVVCQPDGYIQVYADRKRVSAKVFELPVWPRLGPCDLDDLMVGKYWSEVIYPINEAAMGLAMTVESASEYLKTRGYVVVPPE